VIGLTFATGLIGTAHHYFWIGVPEYWLPLGGFFSAMEPLPFLGMAIMAYVALRSMERRPANMIALHWAVGSAMVALIGAGVLGFAHTWPAVNQWTHGTLITPMHGHLAFFGAYGMIILAMISFSMPYVTGNPDAEVRHGGVGLWAFWLMVAGITGITLSFGAAGLGQVYLERIMGLGYLETQAADPGPLPDAAGHGVPVRRGRAPVPLRLLRAQPEAGRDPGGTGANAEGAGGDLSRRCGRYPSASQWPQA
jgi:nitric oxide reductase subunit B